MRMVCNNCGRENRPDACFCRFCGEPLVQETTQKGLIGKEPIVSLLDELDKKLQVAKIVAQGGTRIGLDCLILGDSGTGKNFIADLIAAKMMACGVVKKPATKVDAADWEDFASDFDKKIAELKDSILLITNARNNGAVKINSTAPKFRGNLNESGSLTISRKEETAAPIC